MEIGVFTFYTDYSIDVAVLGRRAEELGFRSLWAPEHPIIPVTSTSPFPFSDDGIIPKSYAEIADPFVVLARVSAVTKTLKLGTAICLVPEHNPLLLAKEIATLDYLSGGRFIFGIGAGWLKEETEIMGGNFPHRWGQTREAIQAMKQLWTKDEAEYHGRYFDFPPVRSFPKPVQKPHPPVLTGGNIDNAFKRAVEWCDGWIPTRATPELVREGRQKLNELAVQAGRDPASIQVVALGVPADREELEALEEAGADAAVVRLTTLPEKESLAELEQVARKVLA